MPVMRSSKFAFALRSPAQNAGYVRLLRADLVVHERCYERRVPGSRGARSRLWRDEEGTCL